MYSRYNNNRASSYRGSRGRYSNNNAPEYSRAKFVQACGKKGWPCVTARRTSRINGIVKYLCSPSSVTKEHTGKSGKTFFNWVCKVQKEDSKPELVSCLYYPDTKTVIIPDLGISINSLKGFVAKIKK